MTDAIDPPVRARRRAGMAMAVMVTVLVGGCVNPLFVSIKRVGGGLEASSFHILAKGEAQFDDEVLADAEITATLPASGLRAVAISDGGKPVRTDAKGRFQFDLGNSVMPGDWILLTATKGGQRLHVLTRVGVDLRAVADPEAPVIALTAASTMVAKAVTPTLVPLLMGKSQAETLVGVTKAIQAMTADTKQSLQAPIADKALSQAMATVKATPTDAALDEATQALIAVSGTTGTFTSAIRTIDRAILANIRSGALPLLPATWDFGGLTVLAPVVVSGDATAASVTFEAETAPTTVAGIATATSQMKDVVAQLDGFLANGVRKKPVVVDPPKGTPEAPAVKPSDPPPASGGGGGGGGGGAGGGGPSIDFTPVIDPGTDPVIVV